MGVSDGDKAAAAGSIAMGQQEGVPESKGPKVYRLLDSVKKAIVVMGSCLLLFAAARNSFHWHIHRIWGATGSFWQSWWDHMYKEWFHEDDFALGCLGSFVVTLMIFWLSNLFFLLVDITGTPGWMLKYKIQQEQQVPWPKMKKALQLVTFNQFVVGLPFSVCSFYLMKWRGNSMSGEMPTFPWVMFEILVFSFVEEIMFYYSHRTLHHPRLYKHIHKIHHEWTAPTGIISLYAHPFEHFLSNILPVTMGPILMGSHLATAWLWFMLAIMSTTIAHCGYHLPLLPSPEAHDYHHLKFNQNFGVLGVLDRLHGTDLQFRASRQYQRHVMLLNTVPILQQIPDSPKRKPE